jgi:hypothetical protein
VLTLWAAVVAEALGSEQDEALTLGRAVTEPSAYSKGVSLGLFLPTSRKVKELPGNRYAMQEKFKSEIALLAKEDGEFPASRTWA